MSLIDTQDGKIKLDRLEGAEKRVLVDAFLKSDPLHLLWFAARGEIKKPGVRVHALMRGVEQQPSFTLFFKLLDDEVIETTVESREDWLASLRKELQQLKSQA